MYTATIFIYKPLHWLSRMASWEIINRRKRALDQLMKTIFKARAKNKTIDYQKLIHMTMDEFDVSFRTAKEYVDTAKRRV